MNRKEKAEILKAEARAFIISRLNSNLFNLLYNTNNINPKLDLHSFYRIMANDPRMKKNYSYIFGCKDCTHGCFNCSVMSAAINELSKNYNVPVYDLWYLAEDLETFSERMKDTICTDPYDLDNYR